MLHGDELVALLPGFDKGHVQTDFQFLRNHFSFLHHARQRMLVLPGVAGHLFNLGGGHIPRKDAAYADAFPVHFEHDLRRLFATHAEKFLQHDNHELHRRVIVI